MKHKKIKFLTTLTLKLVKRNRAEFDRETNCLNCIPKYVTRNPVTLKTELLYHKLARRLLFKPTKNVF